MSWETGIMLCLLLPGTYWGLYLIDYLYRRVYQDKHRQDRNYSENP